MSDTWYRDPVVLPTYENGLPGPTFELAAGRVVRSSTVQFTLAHLNAFLAILGGGQPVPRPSQIRMHPTAWIVVKAHAGPQPMSPAGIHGFDWRLPVFEDVGLPLLGWEIRDQHDDVMSSGVMRISLPEFKI